MKFSMIPQTRLEKCQLKWNPGIRRLTEPQYFWNCIFYSLKTLIHGQLFVAHEVWFCLGNHINSLIFWDWSLENPQKICMWCAVSWCQIIRTFFFLEHRDCCNLSWHYSWFYKVSIRTRKWKYRTFIGPIFHKLYPLLWMTYQFTNFSSEIQIFTWFFFQWQH